MISSMGRPIPMVEEKHSVLPPIFMKGFFTFLLIVSIVLLVGWTTVMYIRAGRLFDVGLYSVFIVLFTFGLTGRLLYSHKISSDEA